MWRVLFLVYQSCSASLFCIATGATSCFTHHSHFALMRECLASNSWMFASRLSEWPRMDLSGTLFAWCSQSNMLHTCACRIPACYHTCWLKERALVCWMFWYMFCLVLTMFTCYTLVRVVSLLALSSCEIVTASIFHYLVFYSCALRYLGSCLVQSG